MLTAFEQGWFVIVPCLLHLYACDLDSHGFIRRTALFRCLLRQGRNTEYIFSLLKVLGFEECHWSKLTVAEVSSCPKTRTEFEDRRKNKNCEALANFQNCTLPPNFLYHCINNEFGNATVEVCGPSYIINGKSAY